MTTTDTASAIIMLVSAALEAFVHQLVYVGNVYPADSFTKSTFLGIVGHVNRHSGVVDYISQCVRVAVAVLVTTGGQMNIVLGDKEIFVLSMRVHPQQQDVASATLPGLGLRLLESRLRDLILSVHAMDRRRQKLQSFQIQLFPRADCRALVRSMSDGLWYQVNQNGSDHNNSMIRPIYDIEADDCEISFFSKHYD